MGFLSDCFYQSVGYCSRKGDEGAYVLTNYSAGVRYSLLMLSQGDQGDNADLMNPI